MDEIQKIDENILQKYQKSYRPYYNYNTDYQTDAPSYYDYLGNLNNIFTSIIDTINKQVEYVNAISNKDIKIEDTETIKLLMEGDFKVDNQILLKGRLKTSNTIENRQYNGKTFDIRNAVIIKDDGIYIRDYTEVIAYLSSLIETNKTIIEEHKNNIETLVAQDSNMTKRISDLEKGINEIYSNGELASADDLQALQIKVETLENKVNTINTTMLSGFQTVTSYQNKNNDVIKSLADRINVLENK